MVVDHVVMLVPDAMQAAEALRRLHGLGSERGPYLPFAGARSHIVPLEPPTYLEFLTIENRDAAKSTDAGQRLLASEAAGTRLFSWSVLVDDLEAVSERLGIAVFDYTTPHGDGTLRGWRSVTGPPRLPFFIDYPNNGDRVGRWQALYARVGHTCSPGGFSELTISGSESEMLDWLGPHRLPLRFIEGQQGICGVRIATAMADLVIR
jgi:hypothetical protein